MKSLKEEALRAISSLPEDAQIDEIMYRLYVINKISNGQKAVENNKTISTEELLKEMESR